MIRAVTEAAQARTAMAAGARDDLPPSHYQPSDKYMRDTAHDMFGAAMRIGGRKVQRNPPAVAATSFGEKHSPCAQCAGARRDRRGDRRRIAERHCRCARGAGDRSGSADSPAWRADAGSGARLAAYGGGVAMKVLFAGPSCATLLPSLRGNPGLRIARAGGLWRCRTRHCLRVPVRSALSTGASRIRARSGTRKSCSPCPRASRSPARRAWAPCGRRNARPSAWSASATCSDRYARGEFEDDGDVAQLHGPAELGFIALSEPLANIVATLEALSAEKLDLA